MKNIFLPCVMLLTVTFTVAAQQNTLTFEQAVKTALGGNYDIQIQREALKSAEGQLMSEKRQRI